jgi:hypothetical protein
MVTCERCGAALDTQAQSCPYCGTQTAFGLRVAADQAAFAQHAAQVTRARQEDERRAAAEPLRKKSLYALVCSLLGTLFCCVPLTVLGVVLGLRAKALARQHQLVAPVSSTAAVVLGAFGALLFVVVVALFFLDQHRHEQRVEQLSRAIERAAGAATLDQRTACTLAEHRLLVDGWQDKPGLSISDFECAGKVEQDGDRAVLRDVRFRASPDPRTSVKVCLSRGTRWSVAEVRAAGECKVEK